MTKLVIGIPTLTRYDLLIRLLIKLSRDIYYFNKLEVVVLDNGGKLSASNYLEKNIDSEITKKINLITPAYNLGVPSSWNFFIRNYGRCIIANDDVVFSKIAIECFEKASLNNPQTIIFENHDTIAGFSTFLVNRPEEWIRLGGFDELLSPAYFEDNDCRYRLSLNGNPVLKVQLADWFHDNSSTLSASTESYRRMHWCLYSRNKLYYKKKWGGLPGNEVYETPFDTYTV